jgi:hypothetical protein
MRSSASRSDDKQSADSKRGADQEEEEEVISPLKTRVLEARAGRDQVETNANRQLFQAQRSDEQPKVRKRKSKGSDSS